MLPLITDLIGYGASATATVIMVPQVIKIVRTRNVTGLSALTIVFYFVNCSLWLAYGWLLGAAPIVICNVIAVAVGLAQLILWLKYRRVLPVA